MSPSAPLGETAAGSNADSTAITALTSAGSTRFNFAFRSISGANFATFGCLVTY